jgi:predicted HD phosphohydrolase
MTAETILEETIAACESMAGLPYDGEPVDQLQHALQSAALAAGSAAAQDLEFVAACLLHDVARAPAVAGVQYDAPDEHHGEAGARWLTPRYGARVAQLAERHVAAKRYLVATDADYLDALSPVSRQTLIAQGGAMSPAEVANFESDPDHRLAVQLRRFDDRAKVLGLAVEGLDAYRETLLVVAARRLTTSPGSERTRAIASEPR